jgi:hypothetical protein
MHLCLSIRFVFARLLQLAVGLGMPRWCHRPVFPMFRALSPHIVPTLCQVKPPPREELCQTTARPAARDFPPSLSVPKLSYANFPALFFGALHMDLVVKMTMLGLTAPGVLRVGSSRTCLNLLLMIVRRRVRGLGYLRRFY